MPLNIPKRTHTTNTYDVPPFRYNDGKEHTSTTNSAFAWRTTKGKDWYDNWQKEGDVCLMCNDTGEMKDARYGMVRCMCSIKHVEGEMRKISFRVHTPERSLGDLVLWGSDTAKDRIQMMIDAAKDFERWPIKWLVLSGYPGSGKTHVLQWLANQIGPLALYMTDSDFEYYVHETLQTQDTTLFVDALKSVPILLYDDWGAGHGSKFSNSMLTSVFDFRYNNWREYPTVVATNLVPREMAALNSRIADRILDTEKSVFVSLKEVKSWRTER